MGLRGVIRNVVVATSSLMLIVAAVDYLATPPTAALAISVTSPEAWHGRPGWVVIYGKVATVDGDAISDLQIVLSRLRRYREVIAVMDTEQDGTYRQEIPIEPSPHEFAIDEPARRRFKHAKLVVFLEPGRAYRIDVRAKRHGGFWFVPVGSYSGASPMRRWSTPW